MSQIAENLTTKLQALSPQQLDEVEAYVSTMLNAEDKNYRLVRAAAALSQTSLSHVWDNPEDDVYNEL